jgi:hypothetical protein
METLLGYFHNLMLYPKTKLSKEKVFSNLNKLFEEEEKNKF